MCMSPPSVQDLATNLVGGLLNVAVLWMHHTAEALAIHGFRWSLGVDSNDP